MGDISRESYDFLIDSYNGILMDLCKSFPGSFVKFDTLEFIACPRTNAYFSIKDCKMWSDFAVKVLEFLSREAFKSQPYDSERKNNEYHRKILDGINRFFACVGVSFTEDDIAEIYQRFGNGVRHGELKRLIANADFNGLKEGKTE